MKKTRKRCTGEFKAEVALEAIRGDLTLAKLAATHGIHPTMIATWKRQATDGMPRTWRSPEWPRNEPGYSLAHSRLPAHVLASMRLRPTAAVEVATRSSAEAGADRSRLVIIRGEVRC